MYNFLAIKVLSRYNNGSSKMIYGKEIFMNKFMKVLAASALVATALVGCGKSSTYAKVGLGVISTLMDKLTQHLLL